MSKRHREMIRNMTAAIRAGYDYVEVRGVRPRKVVYSCNNPETPPPKWTKSQFREMYGSSRDAEQVRQAIDSDTLRGFFERLVEGGMMGSPFSFTANLTTLSQRAESK